MDILVEFAAAVRALHLSVAEQIQLGQKLVVEQFDAVRRSIAPVVAVGKVEGVNVPGVGRIAKTDDLFAQFVSGDNLGAAAFTRVIESMLIYLLGGRVMDDVHRLDALVMGLEPGVDPERFNTDDFLLLVGHGAGDVHHVNDDGNALRLVYFLPTAILLVLAYGHDYGPLGVIHLRSDLPPQGALEGPLEVLERLRAGLADAGVLVARADDVLLAARLDARQSQFLAQDGRQFFQRQFHFKDVSARLVPGAALSASLRRP